MGIMERAYVLAIQVNRDIVSESDNRKSFLGLRFGLNLHRGQVPGLTAFFQPLADVVLGDDGSVLLKQRVPSGVIAVIMRVDDKPDRLVGDALQGGTNFVGQGGIFVIDNDNAVLAN